MELWNARVRESQIYGMLELRGLYNCGVLKGSAVLELQHRGVKELWNPRVVGILE